MNEAIRPEQRAMLEEARTLILDGGDHGVTLRAVGGIGIAFLCPTAMEPPLARQWKDIDFVGLSRDTQQIEAYLEGRGLHGFKEFNALHGHQRLNFVNKERGYQIDVFIDRLVMCHTLELADRLSHHELTLDPADLLLTKLQVVETNERDYKDILAVLVDHQIDEQRIVGILSRDWGWWRTATQVLAATVAYAHTLPEFPARDAALDAVARLTRAIAGAPKSRGWRLRARVGDRLRWYELPEEDDEGI
jgi:hypothetical protein